MVKIDATLNDAVKITSISGKNRDIFRGAILMDKPNIPSNEAWRQEHLDSILDEVSEKYNFVRRTLKVDRVSPGQYNIGHMYYISGKLSLPKDVAGKLRDGIDVKAAADEHNRKIDDEIAELEKEFRKKVSALNKTKVRGPAVRIRF